uniref:C-X-C motif chemokine n=1 Tax=Anabas testudineus TaxID=64144 RepID=A0A3Q1H5W4_ANATE
KNEDCTPSHRPPGLHGDWLNIMCCPHRDEKIKNTIYSKCRCVKTSKMVNPSQIVRVEVINQGFYCRRIEVIAQLKNNLSVCLDPKAPFIIRILKKLYLDKYSKKSVQWLF